MEYLNNKKIKIKKKKTGEYISRSKNNNNS